MVVSDSDRVTEVDTDDTASVARLVENIDFHVKLKSLCEKQTLLTTWYFIGGQKQISIYFLENSDANFCVSK